MMKRTVHTIAATSLALGVLLTPAYASDFDNYITYIESGTEAQRVEARQMLPGEGLRAVPALLELLQHEDQLVWRNARNILADIANDLAIQNESQLSDLDQELILYLSTTKDYEGSKSRQKRYAKRMAEGSVEVVEAMTMSRYLLELVLDENTPPHAVKEGLRLFGVVGVIDYGLSSLPEHLENPEYFEEMVSALINMSDPLPFPMFRGSLGTMDFEIIEDILHKGGNWDSVISMYTEALNDDEASFHAPAISGLARYGDETVIPTIFAALKENPELEAPALMGLNDMFGLASYEALLEAYPNTSYEMQLGLLGVFGRKQHEIFLPLLLENAANEDRARQTAAFGALVQSDLAGAAAAIVKYVASVPEEDRRFEIGDLLVYADRMHSQGRKDAAGKAYLGLYRTATENDDKDIAFHGIKQYPSAEAYELILADLDFDNLDEVSAETLIALNVMIKEESNPEDFAKIRKALTKVVKETAHVESVLRMAAQQNALDQFLPLLGYVKQWHIVGSFPWSSAENFTANPVGAPAVDLTASYTVDGESLAWQKIDAGLIVNLMGIYGSKTNSTMYAYTTINSKEAMDAQLRLGSDDGVRVWLNGVSEHENNVDRGVDLDQDIVDVTLNEGENKILLQVTQGGGGWGYTFRVTHRDGAPFIAD